MRSHNDICSRCLADHANSPPHLRQISVRDDCWRLIINKTPNTEQLFPGEARFGVREKRDLIVERDLYFLEEGNLLRSTSACFRLTNCPLVLSNYAAGSTQGGAFPS